MDYGTGGSDEEMVFYLSLFFSHCHTSALGTTATRFFEGKKNTPGKAYFEYIASYLCNGYNKFFTQFLRYVSLIWYPLSANYLQ